MTRSRAIYAIVATLLVALLLVMLFRWNYDRATAEAEDKATQLISSYEEAGYATPLSADAVARVLGEDAEVVCEGLDSDQQLAYLKTQLVVGGEFYQRPVTIDRRRLEGLRLIAQTYCPDRVSAVEEFIDGLEYAVVVRY